MHICHLMLAFFTMTTLASQVEYLTSLMKLALRSLSTFSLTAFCCSFPIFLFFCTPLLKIKFPTLTGKIVIVKEDQNQARQCYTESLKGAPYPSTREPAKPHPTMDDTTQVMSMDERSLVQALIAYQASLECFPIHDINGVTLVDEDLIYHEVGDYDGDNHGIVLMDKGDTLEVSINESDRRETSW